jgi:hypothetical protein
VTTWYLFYCYLSYPVPLYIADQLLDELHCVALRIAGIRIQCRCCTASGALGGRLHHTLATFNTWCCWPHCDIC